MLFAIIAGPSALLEDCQVADFLNGTTDKQSRVIQVAAGSIVRRCTVTAVNRQSPSPSTTDYGIRGTVGSLVEDCVVDQIGTGLNSAGFTIGILIQGGTCRGNLVRRMYSTAQSTQVTGIVGVSDSRVENNHIMDLRGTTVAGISAINTFSPSIVTGNTIGKLQPQDGTPDVTNYSMIGILGGPGVVDNNSIDISSSAITNGGGDLVLRTGIQVWNSRAIVTGNNIYSRNVTILGSDRGIHLLGSTTNAYLAANILNGCNYFDEGTGTVLGAVPAPNHGF